MKQFAEFVEVEVVSNLRKENDYTLDEKIERLPAMFWKALIFCHNEMERIWDMSIFSMCLCPASCVSVLCSALC